MLRGFLFSLLGALAVLVVETGLYFLLRRLGVAADVALLGLAIFSLVMLLVVGAMLFLQFNDEGNELRPRALPWVRYGSSAIEPALGQRPGSPANVDRGMWNAAAQLESTVRQITGEAAFTRVASTPGRSVEEPASAARHRPSSNVEHRRPVIELQAFEAGAQPSAKPASTPRSAADLLGQIEDREREVALLLNRSKSRLNDIERLMENRIHLINSETIKAHMSAKRIIGALERRLERVHVLAAGAEAGELVKARSLLEADLVVPTDTLNTVVGTEEIPSIPAAELRPILERLLSTAENALRALDQRTRRSY